MLGAQQTALAAPAQFLALAVVLRSGRLNLRAERADVRQIAGRFVEDALKVGKALLRAVFEAQTLLIHHLAHAVAGGGDTFGAGRQLLLPAVHMGGKVADHAVDALVDGIQPTMQGLQLPGIALHGFQQRAQIEGAADGVGLGHDFLRHIDRCRLLVHIVDVSGSEDRDPVDDFEKINEELRQYSPDLASRPMLVAANKADLLPPDSDNLDRLKAHVEAQGYEFYVISAATTQGTRELMKTIAGKLAALPPVTIYEPEYVKPLAEAGDANELQIERYDDLWVVSGKWLQKLLNDINFDDYESRMYFDRQLRKSGLFDRLEEQGIEDGDTVSIYDFEFDYTK